MAYIIMAYVSLFGEHISLHTYMQTSRQSPTMHKCVYICATGDVGCGKTEAAACSERRSIEDAHTAPSASDRDVACVEHQAWHH